MNSLLESQFNQFMQQMRGFDPNAIINQLVASGKITQQQLDQAQRQVNNDFKNRFERIRRNFGL